MVNKQNRRTEVYISLHKEFLSFEIVHLNSFKAIVVHAVIASRGKLCSRVYKKDIV